MEQGEQQPRPRARAPRRSDVAEVTTPTQALLTERDAARFLNVAPAYLRKNRSRAAKSPVIPFVRLGGKIRYRLADLVDFISANTHRGQ